MQDKIGRPGVARPHQIEFEDASRVRTAVIRIGLIVFQGVQALDVSGPLDVFSEANRFLPQGQGYACQIIGLEPGPVRCSNGTVLVPDLACDDGFDPFDTVLVAGGPQLARERPSEAVVSRLGRLASVRRYGSVCTGAFLLGHAGLLAGKTVTTHWEEAATLAAMFPHARVQPDRLYIQDGRLFTSAGVTAGIDLAVYLLSQDHGPEVALQVARRLVIFTHRSGGQSQFSPYLVPPRTRQGRFHATYDYVRAHLREPLTVAHLAQVCGMSERHFSRTFAEEAGMAPADFVEACRVDAARALLEATTTPLKVVADLCGFGGAQHMRRVFTRRLGVSASSYRGNFKMQESGEP